MNLRKSHRNSGYVTDTNAHTRGAGAIAAMDGRSRKAAALGALAERTARRRDRVKAQYALGKDNTPGFANVAVTGGTYTPKPPIAPKPPGGKPLLKVPFQGNVAAVATGTGGHLKIPLPVQAGNVKTGGKAPPSSGGKGKSPFDASGDRSGGVLPGAVTVSTSPTTGVTTTTVTIPGTTTTVSSPSGGSSSSGVKTASGAAGAGAGLAIEPEDFDEMPIISMPAAAAASTHSSIPTWAWYAAGGVGLWFLLRGE